MNKWLKRFYWVVVIVCVSLAALAIASVYALPKNVRLLAVESGSMAPKLPVGSVVIVKKADNYEIGQIIAFNRGQAVITHRVMAWDNVGGKTYYTTRGDANNMADLDKVPPEAVLGKVVVDVPLAGYLTTFVKTQTGFILLIMIPATIIIWTELLNIKNQTKRLLKERKKRKLSLAEKIEVAIGQGEEKIEKNLEGK